jgi:hypothetical protein
VRVRGAIDGAVCVEMSVVRRAERCEAGCARSLRPPLTASEREGVSYFVFLSNSNRIEIEIEIYQQVFSIFYDSCYER